MRINVRTLKEQGLKLRNEATKVKEQERVGTLRGGSGGLEFEDGMHTGTCMRKAYARSIGIQSDIDGSTDLMFSAGLRNEDSWDLDLTATYKHKIIKADDYVEWATSNGTKVTGSPDVLLFDAEDKPVLVLEHKHVSSGYTALSVGTGERGKAAKPKLAAVIQLGHYMNEVGVDGDLIYTNSVNLALPAWAENRVPLPPEPGHELVNYTYYSSAPDGVFTRGKNKGKPRTKDTKVNIGVEDQDKDWVTLTRLYPEINKAKFKYFKPFFVVYNCKFDGDVLMIKGENETEYRPTIVTKKRIVQYYETVSTIKEKGLPNRPLNLDVYGEPEFFNSCDYCEYRSVCDRLETDKQKWEAAIKRL